jgi:hypothetical protein
MKNSWLFAIVPSIIASVVGIFVLALLVVKLLWAWTIPDIFPGAVQQGLITGTISWFTALKVAIFVAVLFGIADIRGSGRKKG